MHNREPAVHYAKHKLEGNEDDHFEDRIEGIEEPNPEVVFDLEGSCDGLANGLPELS